MQSVIRESLSQSHLRKRVPHLPETGLSIPATLMLGEQVASAQMQLWISKRRGGTSVTFPEVRGSQGAVLTAALDTNNYQYNY